jgi:hypothetical protein
MSYKLTTNAAFAAIRVSDGALIPYDPGNVDYRGYLAWLNEANTPLPADPIPTPTPTLTRLEFMDRFTGEEEDAIYASNIPAIKRAVRRMEVASFIDVTRQDTINYVNGLEALGLIGPGRAAVILAP